ncbi:MAG: hypothetical protein HY001_05490 [Candidatus Portnoybacteria bacterium]|nr:hypothetical protein [Candidatus Portnoybacteria bacterium]
MRKITVDGEDSLIKKHLIALVQRHFPYLFSSSAKALFALRSEEIEIKEISLTLDMFSRSLHASYTPRLAHFLWCSSLNCFLVDDEGVIFKHSAITQSTLVIPVDDLSFEGVAVGKKIPPPFLETLWEIEKDMKDKNLAIERFIIQNPFSLTVRITGAPEIRLNPKTSASTQLANFSQFFSSLPSEKFLSLEYVDLRVKNRIYYK